MFFIKGKLYIFDRQTIIIMKADKFISFNMDDRIDSIHLNHLFESAWDTLSELYPDLHLDASDCYTIYAFSNDYLLSDHESESYFVFDIGICNYSPALHNLKTNEVIPIKINNYSWY